MHRGWLQWSFLISTRLTSLLTMLSRTSQHQVLRIISISSVLNNIFENKPNRGLVGTWIVVLYVLMLESVLFSSSLIS
jgi:hypothetical protein